MASDEPPASPDEPHLSPHEIQQLDNVLSDFKRSLQLPQGDPGRALADQNMRQVGFSVPQIMALSGEHNLPESTVKGHVRGIIAPAGAPAQKAVQFLTSALDQNVTFQSINDFLEAKSIADANKVTMKDIIELVRALNVQQIPLNNFIDDYKELKNLDITPLNLKSFLDYKVRMEKKGFGLNQLGLVNDASEKYGGPEKVLKAIEKYKDLQELQNLIKTATAEQRKLSEQLETDRKETATLERQRKDLSEQIESDTITLARLKRLRDLGYDDTRLRDLATSTSSLGGVQKVLAALGKLHDVNELQLTISELRKTKALLEQEKANMETANAHLKAHIDATTKLIEEHQLGLDAIAGLLRIAKKYGTPPQVLKAFETYDSLEQLKKEKKKTEDEVKKARTRVDELTNQEKELRNLVSELLPTIEKDLKDWIKGLNEKIGETTKSVTSTLNSQNEAFKKDFNDSLKDVKDLKTILDADFKSIKDNADKEVKALADTMKSTVDEGQKDFAKAFKATKENILDEIKSLLDAAHELDKAYAERKSDLPQLKAFLQLIDLVNEPSKVADISFLSTIQLTLRKTSDWINLNPTKFGYYPSPTDLTDSIRRTEDLLSKVNFEPHPST